jgi:hypothetical protein
MLGEGSQPIEIVGTIKEFVPCFVEPGLSSQVSQDFSRVPVFLGFRRRQKNFDHVDFPPISRSGRDNASERFQFQTNAGRYARPYGVLCSPAPTRGAGSSSRTWKTPPAVSTLAATHHRATK